MLTFLSVFSSWSSLIVKFYLWDIVFVLNCIHHKNQTARLCIVMRIGRYDGYIEQNLSNCIVRLQLLLSQHLNMFPEISQECHANMYVDTVWWANVHIYLYLNKDLILQKNTTTLTAWGNELNVKCMKENSSTSIAVKQQQSVAVTCHVHKKGNFMFFCNEVF